MKNVMKAPSMGGKVGKMVEEPKIQTPGPMTSWTGVSGVGDPKLKTGYKKV